MAEIRFRCQGCQRKLSVDNSHGGRAIPCPACGVRLVIPGASAVSVQDDMLQFWGLSFPPFENLGGEDLFFPASQHTEAIARANFALQTGKAGVLILGDYGVGKTFVKNLLVKQFNQDPSLWVEVLDNVLLTPAELLRYLLSRLLTVEAYAAESATGGWESPAALQDRLAAAARDILANQNRRMVLFLDEMQLVQDPVTLEQIRLLMNLVDSAGRPLFTFMLFGQQSLLRALERSPSFLQRVSIRWKILPLSEGQTAEYIRHRLYHAGAKQDIFTHDAIRCIHEASSGLPRTINNLCDLCMHFSHLHRSWEVGRDMVEAAAADVSSAGAVGEVVA